VVSPLCCSVVSLGQVRLLYDWRSVSMFWYRAPLWDLRPDITSCRNVAVRNLQSCFCGAPSLTRGRVYNLQRNQEQGCPFILWVLCSLSELLYSYTALEWRRNSPWRVTWLLAVSNVFMLPVASRLSGRWPLVLLRNSWRVSHMLPRAYYSESGDGTVAMEMFFMATETCSLVLLCWITMFATCGRFSWKASTTAYRVFDTTWTASMLLLHVFISDHRQT
jgi:hypothetical protein